MSWLRALLALPLVACVDSAADDKDLATDDAAPISADKLDAPGWLTAPTLHADTSLHDYAAAGDRRVHSMWISGSTATPVPLTISARTSTDYDVRIAVLGPLVNGTRAVLGADGYTARKRDVSLSLAIAEPGDHLVVVGSWRLASDTFYELAAACNGAACTATRVDALASPKDFALVGDPSRLVSMELGEALLGYGDIEVEVWASQPMLTWNAQQVGISQASGSQINAIMPPSVQAGDDLRLVVREASGGRILDTGVATRFAPQAQAFARLDAVVYGDIASLQISGVVGFFEGQADMRLYSETRHIEIAQSTVHADRPGQVGNGLNAFDATFIPELSVAAADGELLSTGFINGNGDYRRLGCFEYCNNLSGMSSCTGGPRPCP